MRNFCVVLICFLLTACATGTGSNPDSNAPLKTAVTLSSQDLRNELAKIPEARVAEGQELIVSFPVGSLFTEVSALPMPGGTAPLDALATIIKQSGVSWRLRVRALTGDGASYDIALAATRAKILKTYFNNAGVNLRTIEITEAAEPGAPLELKPIQ